MIQTPEGGSPPEVAGRIEPQSEDTTPVSTEELRKQRLDLESQIAAAQRKHADDLKQKLSNREILAKDGLEVKRLQNEAHIILQHYKDLKDSGSLTDQKDHEGLEKIEKIITDLQQQRDQIGQAHSLLMQQPEVNTAVVTEAGKENEERDFVEAIESAKKVLYQEVEKIVKACQPLAEKQRGISERQSLVDSMVAETDSKARKIVDDAIASVGSKNYYGDDLIPSKEYKESYGEYFARLEGLRDKLGIFSPRDKKLVFKLVLTLANLVDFNAVDGALAEKTKWRSEFDLLQQEIKSLGEQYKQLILDAWKKQKEIIAKYPGPGQAKPNQELAAIAYAYFDYHLEELGDVERYDQKTNQHFKGRHKNIDGAMQANPRLSELYSMVNRVKKTGGDYNNVGTEPKESKT